MGWLSERVRRVCYENELNSVCILVRQKQKKEGGK